MLSAKQRLKLIGFALGIFVSYLVFGLLQERILRKNYGVEENSEQFKNIFVFIGAQFVFYTIFAKTLTLTHNHPENKTHHGFYIGIAIFYLLAMFLSNTALQYVPYPTQVIGKSSKPIVVICFGAICGRKSYSMQKLFFVFVIVLGVVMFIYKDKYEQKDDEKPLIGNSLICASLLMEGIMAAVQERMRSSCKPSSLNFMMFVNLYSAIFVGLATILSSKGFEFVEFATRHPEILWHLGLLVTVGAFGQTFIFSTIANFGTLPLSIVTTTRKFFTVLLSVLIFSNNLSIRQWIAAGLVFTALLGDACFSKKPEPKEKDQILKVNNGIDVVPEIEKILPCEENQKAVIV